MGRAVTFSRHSSTTPKKNPMNTDRPPLEDIAFEYIDPSHVVSLMEYRWRKETSREIECSKEDILKDYKDMQFNTSLEELLEPYNGTFSVYECQIDELENPFLFTLNGTIENGRIFCVEKRTPVPPASVFLEHMNEYEQRVYKTYYDHTGSAPLCYKSHTWEGDVMVVTFGAATFNLLGEKPLWEDVEEVYRIDVDDPATHVYLGDRTVMKAFLEHFKRDTSPSVSSSSASRPTIGGKSPRSRAARSESLPTVAGKSPRPSVSFSDDVPTRRCGKAPVPGFDEYGSEALEDDGSEEDVSNDGSEEDGSEAMEEDDSVGTPTRPQTGVKSPVVMEEYKRRDVEERKDGTYVPDDEEVQAPLPKFTRTTRSKKRKRTEHGSSCICSKCVF